MSELPSRIDSSEEPAPRRRSRLHLLYFLLAAFDLVTVSFSLYLINRLTVIHDDSVQVNQVWASRLGSFSELSQLATRVNAPGNDVFYSRDVAAEALRLTKALSRFHEQATVVSEDLIHNVDAEQRAPLLEDLDVIEEAMASMAAEAERIFSRLRNNAIDEAGKRMAEMDRHYARVTSTLADLGQRVRVIQQSHFEEQAAVATSLRKFELLIAGLIALMVVGVAVYGHKLAKRFKESTRLTEQSLRELADREARIRGIVEGARDGIITVGVAETIDSVNPAGCRMFGYDEQDLVGRGINSVLSLPRVATAPAAGELRPWLRLRESGPHDDVMGHRRDGSSFPAELVTSEVQLPDRRFWTCLVRDITERREAEAELSRHREHLESLVEERTARLEASHEQLRLAERMAAIGTLAAGLGHDMNNLLFPLRCRFDALESPDLEAGVREELATMRQSVEYLQQLSDGLRLLALDPADPEGSPEVTHLDQWWQGVERLIRTALPEGARLVTDLPADFPPIAVAPHRLTQAIFNLVVNAGEALVGEGTVRIVAREIEDSRFVRFTVRDDGHGMSREVKRRALDPFFTTKKRALSTGLGLTLVHGVAQATGGTVEIESAEARGTAISVTFPRAEPDERRPGPDRQASITLRDRRVGSFVSGLLQSEGFAVRDNSPEGPPAGRIWVAEPSSDALARAREFLRASPRNRVILFGKETPEWKALGATVVEDSSGLETIRRAIQEAARTTPGADQ